jgi:hypothetical protein
MLPFYRFWLFCRYVECVTFAESVPVGMPIPCPATTF